MYALYDEFLAPERRRGVIGVKEDRHLSSSHARHNFSPEP